MIYSVLKKILTTILTIWAVATLTFLMLHFLPGDPVDLMLGDGATSQDRQALQIKMGLDKPVSTQYTDYFSNLLKGDLGKSFLTDRPVSKEIAMAYPYTVKLGLWALAISIFVGVPIGIFFAANSSKLIDASIFAVSTISAGLPTFLLGPILILIFAVKLQWVPLGSPDSLSGIILPILTLGFGISIQTAQLTRNFTLEVLNSEFVRTARSKGCSSMQIYFRHILLNILPSLISLFAIQAGYLLTGLVVTETVFDWPGIGILFYSALQSRNYPLVQGCVILIATTYILILTMTDSLILIFDPRKRS